jgi:flagellar hook-length control protein FliK
VSSSLISVGSIGAPATAGASVSAGGEAAPKTLMDVFAALLGNATGDTGAEITQESSATVNGIEIGGGVRALLASLLGGQTSTVDDAGAPAEGGDLPGLADLLLKIEASLDAGETVDPELLKKLKESIDALAALIGGPVDASAAIAVKTDLPIAVDAAAVAKVDTPAGDPETEPQLPELKTFADRLKELAGKLGDVDPNISAKLEALADKLSALKTTVADLIEEAPELKAVIDALVQSKTDVKVAATASVVPVLATPELKLPQVISISGKKAADDAAAPPVSDTDGVPDDAEVSDGPKLQVKADAKAEVKADLSASPTAAPKADTPAPAPAAPTPQTDPSPASAIAATATAGVHATEHGALRAQVHTAYTPPSPVNLPHMAFEIVRHVQQGVSKFQIRLDPPELGRIDVNLDMDKSGQVNARLTVERSETLDLLQRDQRSLERALAQAGLDAGKTNLEFSLKQNPFAGRDGGGQNQQGGSPFASGVPGSVIAEAEAAPAVAVYRGTASPGGVNMFV